MTASVTDMRELGRRAGDQGRRGSRDGEVVVASASSARTGEILEYGLREHFSARPA
ncbi:hypothetical protein [Nocardia sp. NPDC003963]